MLDLFPILNRHRAFPSDVDLSEGRYVSLFQNKHGEQIIFSGDPVTREAQLAHGDDDWRIHDLSPELMYPGLRLSDDEQAWLLACWTALLHTTADETLPRLVKHQQIRAIAIQAKVDAPGYSPRN